MLFLGKIAGFWLAACLIASPASAGSDSSGRPYGVLFVEPSAEDLRRDEALLVVRRLRQELSQNGSLTPESAAQAKQLQRGSYSLLEQKDRALVNAVLSLRLGGFSVMGPGAAVKVPPPAPVPPELLAEEEFPVFLRGLRAEAAKDGVPGAVLDEALAGLTVDPKVLAAESSQPEHTITFEEYLSRVVSDKRVASGRQQLAANSALLEKVSGAYLVAPPMLVSLWGMESSYGANLGSWQVIRSLATLAYAGKRPTFFRKELIAALHILADERMAAKDLLGSWAGALGQPQFMPSTFRRLAVDFDGDGRRDIWKSPADVLACIANYLAKSGWVRDSAWGTEVSLPKGFDQASASLSVVKSVKDWAALGVRAAAGSALPAEGFQASIVRPSGEGGRAFLVGHNFRVVMRYNNSTYYATAGGLLADRIGR